MPNDSSVFNGLPIIISNFLIRRMKTFSLPPSDLKRLEQTVSWKFYEKVIETVCSSRFRSNGGREKVFIRLIKKFEIIVGSPLNTEESFGIFTCSVLAFL